MKILIQCVSCLQSTLLHILHTYSSINSSFQNSLKIPFLGLLSAASPWTPSSHPSSDVASLSVMILAFGKSKSPAAKSSLSGELTDLDKVIFHQKSKK